MTMKRAYSVIELKSVDDDQRIITGIATTPTPDGMDDIVEPKGGEFKLPLPFLWQHDSRQPIGHVTKAKVTKDGIQVEIKMVKTAEPGALKDRLDDAWQSIKLGLVRGLSIGFRALETSRNEGTYGLRFIRWVWLELSAVTIPANSEATITAIKSIDASHLAASGRGKASLPPPGVPGRSNSQNKGNGNMKTLAERITAGTTRKGEIAARMEELLDDEGRVTGEAEKKEYGELSTELDELDENLGRWTSLQAAQSTAKPVAKSAIPGRTTGPTIIVAKSDPEDKFKGQSFVRMVIAKALGHLEGVPGSAIAEYRWGKSNPQLVQLIKANEVAAGGAVSGAWGAELVTANTRFTGDFIEYLRSKTVFDKLPLREVPANVQIKGQDGTATGYWVGEGKAIPAGNADFSSVNLTPLKVAALAVITNELLRDSSPSAEMLVRETLADASAQRIDGTFLSNTAASNGVSPAGMLNGVSAMTSSGDGTDGLLGDIRQLYAPFIAAKNASGLYFVTTPSLAKSISLMRNALGNREFPELTAQGGMLEGDQVVTGDNVGAGDLILLKPSDIYKIGDTGVEVSISREATIEMNSVPTGDALTPAAQSEDMVNMFQNESTAIKVVRRINFAKRRAGCVQFVGDAEYSHGGSPA